MFQDKHNSLSPLIKTLRSGMLASGLMMAAVAPAWVCAEPVEVPASVQAAIAPLNINVASAEDIADALNGVGLAKAQAIVDYRNEHGPFKTLDDLLNVKGIGPATLAKNEQVIALQ